MDDGTGSENRKIKKGCRSKVDVLDERLREITLLPYEVYTPRLDLTVGALGLEMNAVYSMLHKMQIEFSHAGEYLERGQQKDVKETLEEYADNLQRMVRRLGKHGQTLAECAPDNENVVHKVCGFLEAYEESLTILKSLCELADWDEKVMEIQEQLIRAVDISYQYIKLHLGDTSHLE